MGITPRLFLCLVDGLPAGSAFSAQSSFENPSEGIGWSEDRVILVELLEATRDLVRVKLKPGGAKKIKPFKLPKLKKKTAPGGEPVSDLKRIFGSFAAPLLRK